MKTYVRRTRKRFVISLTSYASQRLNEIEWRKKQGEKKISSLIGYTDSKSRKR